MSQCALPECLANANSSCSRCGREQYCSSICQKLDWKVHKLMCPTLKKLSNKLQPYDEVSKHIQKALASEKYHVVRVLDHLLAYANFQFETHITATAGYREKDGQQISNWDVDVGILNTINSQICGIHATNKHSISVSICNEKMFPYLERSLSLLTPWVTIIYSHEGNRVLNLDDAQIDSFMYEYPLAELRMASVLMSRNLFDSAEGHASRCLTYSKRFRSEGKDKTDMILDALHCYIGLRQRQGKCAVAFAEEAYNHVVTTYDCVHPQVQQAAVLLINCLLHKGESLRSTDGLNEQEVLRIYFDAQRYAEITYMNLRDSKNGKNQKVEYLAQSAYILADVLYRRGENLIKAEKLGRESLRLSTSLTDIGGSCLLVARTLQAQKNYGDETKELFERSISTSSEDEGGLGLNTASAYIGFGKFYCGLADTESLHGDQRKQWFRLALSYLEKGHRIEKILHGATHYNTVQAASLISMIGQLLNSPT